jgi:hypothetical protein
MLYGAPDIGRATSKMEKAKLESNLVEVKDFRFVRRREWSRGGALGPRLQNARRRPES